MFRLLVEKELKNIIQSPKFLATFLTCSFLILLSIGIGINEYFNMMEQYNTAQNLAKTEMTQARSWMALSAKAFREPDPMQIFSAGVNYDIGRYSIVHERQDSKLQNSVYSDDPIFAVFRYMDFTFIVTVVFSLFAILFTYNTVNGERENGTMRLVFSNALPRSTFISAKFVGSWLGLVVPLLVPILVGLLLLVVFKVPLSAAHWIKIIMLISTSVLYLTFFIAFGILISAVTKYSSVSFMILLVAWITLVFIIPRIGVMTASQFISVPTVAELESQKDAFSKARWDKHYGEIEKVWRARNAEMNGMSEADRQSYREENEYKWFEEDDKVRNEVQKEITEYSSKLSDDVRNRKATLENLALNISRISPASSFQLAAMNIATSDINLKNRYEKEIQNYRQTFSTFTQKKQKESGGQAGMFRISIDSQSGVKVSSGRDESSLNLREVPKFTQPSHTISQAVVPTIIDIGLMMFFTLFSFGGAFFAFNKYDLR